MWGGKMNARRHVQYLFPLAAGIVLLVCLMAFGGSSPAQADPELNQSVNVVIIGGSTLDTFVSNCGFSYTAANDMTWTYGGCLPVTGAVGELGDFTFSPMLSSAVSAASLAPYDTAVINLASYDMACNTNTLSAQAKTDLVDFVADGHKLIIFDSECYPGPVDYSWLPYPFTTANPGAMGAPGTLTIVENSTIASTDSLDTHYIDAAYLSLYTDAVGDMNVMTTYNPNWCVAMSGTNYLQVTGPVNTYAKTGLDKGLYIYNGLDQDYLGYYNDAQLRKIWVQELQQPFNPSNLPCGIRVVGISLTPETATNEVGESHTVTASLKDLLAEPQPDILVTFEVISGPNAGTVGVCSANADCTSDVNGEVSFTYVGDGGVGTDEIQACFDDPEGNPVCSNIATKEWTPPPEIPVSLDIRPMSCPNPINMGDLGVLPVAIAGTADFDVTQIDLATIKLYLNDPASGVSPIRWAYADVTTPYLPFLDKPLDRFSCHTLGADGYMDLTLKFNNQSIMAILGLTMKGQVLRLNLIGNLKPEFGGTEIVGEDIVVIVTR